MCKRESLQGPRHGGRVPLPEKAACDAHHRNVSGAALEFRALRQSMLRRNNASDGALQTGPTKIACKYNGFGIGREPVQNSHRFALLAG